MSATPTKAVLLALSGTVAILGGTATVRTARFGPVQLPVSNSDHVALPDGAAERLAAALRYRTVSGEDSSEPDALAFRGLHAHLQSSFPLVHAHLRREVVDAHSLLYTWAGSDPSLPPVLLSGHLDVVPVEPGREREWQRPPFSGHVRDGFVWGRGAIDNKAAVVGTLEAAELLLRERFRPARTIYFAFGHDEEVGGTAGAAEIARLLKERGVELDMVLDEGGVVGEGVFPGVPTPVAMVGIAEKGFATIDLSVRTPGGHSSLPPRQTAAGILSAAVARIESSPMEARLEAPTRLLLDRVGRHVPLVRRAAFANLWLSGPVVLHSLQQLPTTNAMVRTTTAPTILQAGTKDNVLPSHAKAVINARILPGDTVASVVSHVRRVVSDDRVAVALGGGFVAEPSRVSASDSDSFGRLERTIRSMFPDAIVSPFLVVVATDARHYAELSRHVFRFLPLQLTQQDLQRIHGIDERIDVREYERAVRTYRQLMLEWGIR
jgi:carboxypeptidase PM20D1